MCLHWIVANHTTNSIHCSNTVAIFATQPGPVSESEGSVEVCVNVTNANNIPAEGAELIVFVAENQGTNPVLRKN